LKRGTLANVPHGVGHVFQRASGKLAAVQPPYSEISANMEFSLDFSKLVVDNNG
jgi:hypothetical protein